MAAIPYTRDSPSPRYRELESIYRGLHETGMVAASGTGPQPVFTGKSLFDHIPRVRALIRDTGSRTILDYGSGKGLLYEQRDFVIADGGVIASVRDYWGVDAIRCFDPGVPEFSARPTSPYDGVVCTDVLEHIPEEDIDWFLGELFAFADRFVYANVAGYPAKKTLPNGWNAHVTVRPPAWWTARVRAAAQGWRGKTYEIQVREKTKVPRIVRKLAGLSKWKATVISNGSPPSRADGSRVPAGSP